MSGGEETDDKPFEATEKKLTDARKRGDLAKSTDLITAAAYAGFLLAALAFGPGSLNAFGAALAGVIAQADRLADEAFGGGMVFTARLVRETAPPLLLWFALPAGAALAAVLVQRAFVVAPEKLMPKLDRISPLANAKQKFGRAGLFEFAKSALKLTIYALLLGVFLYAELPRLLLTVRLPPEQAIVALGQMTLAFLAIVLVVASAIGVVDALFQQAEHLRKNRMSHKEMTDEMKQMEGDPAMKQQRWAKAQEIALNGMLADVPTADVVVVNPTHYAVALKWSRLPGAAPECVAKGVDEIAARIRERAHEAGVPIHSDPPTARALYGTVEIGQEIRPEHYGAVAAAIRFAETMRTAAKARGR